MLSGMRFGRPAGSLALCHQGSQSRLRLYHCMLLCTCLSQKLCRRSEVLSGAGLVVVPWSSEKFQAEACLK